MEGVTVPAAAARSTSYIHKVYKQLEEDGPTHRPHFVPVPDTTRVAIG